MADFGTLCLFLALAASGWAVIASLNGWRARLGELVLSAERAVYATWALVLLSVLSLEYCIFTDQFGLEYVASYSNRALPKIYKFTALWGRSEEHTSELQSPCNLVCRLLLEKKNCQTNENKRHPSKESESTVRRMSVAVS